MLDKIKDSDLRVYAVYLPVLDGDQESRVASAAKYIPDSRVSYFWDGKGELGPRLLGSFENTRGEDGLGCLPALRSQRGVKGVSTGANVLDASTVGSLGRCTRPSD